jgi:uncharacterized protein GlcG (DUF336 family)
MPSSSYVTHDQDRAAQAVGFVLQGDARVLGGLGVSGGGDEAADEEEPAEATEGGEGEEAPKD